MGSGGYLFILRAISRPLLRGRSANHSLVQQFIRKCNLRITLPWAGHKVANCKSLSLEWMWWLENKPCVLELERIYSELCLKILWTFCNEEEHKVILYFLLWIAAGISKTQKNFLTQHILHISQFYISNIMTVPCSRESDKRTF